MRILRYLKDTTDFGLYYHRHSSQYYPEYEQSKRPSMTDVKQPFAYASSYFPGKARVNLTGFSYADFANTNDDRRSITGSVFLHFLGTTKLSTLLLYPLWSQNIMLYVSQYKKHCTYVWCLRKSVLK